MSHSLSYVAHQDDDLIFMNPDILSDIRAGHRTWVVYLTAGNLIAGPAGMPYADQRIQGVRAAYARAAQVDNEWQFELVTVGGRHLPTNRLVGAPHVRLVFLFISAAAGSDDGDLARMWRAPAYVAEPIDGRASYTRTQFVTTLRDITAHVNPDLVRCQDPQGLDNGDNIDHHHAARMVLTAHTGPDGRVTRRVDTYFGYTGQHWPPNVDSFWAGEKLDVWHEYKPHDSAFDPGSTAWDEMAVRAYRRDVLLASTIWTPW